MDLLVRSVEDRREMPEALRLVPPPLPDAEPSGLLSRADVGAGEHEAFRRRRDERERLEAAYRRSILRSAHRHPSMLGRA
jgi:hypothetical protein